MHGRGGITVLVCGVEVPAWQAFVVTELSRKTGLDVALLKIDDAQPALVPVWGWPSGRRAVQRYHGFRRSIDGPSAMQPKRLPESEIETWRPARLSDSGLNDQDLIINLTNVEVPTTSGRPKEWYFSVGDCPRLSRAPLGFWEHYSNRSVFESLLCERADENAYRAVSRIVTSSDLLHMSSTFDGHLWKCALHLVRETGRVFEAPSVSRAPVPVTGRLPAEPTGLHKAGLIAKVFGRRLSQLVRSKLRNERWTLITVPGRHMHQMSVKHASGSMFGAWQPPEASWADPNCVGTERGTFLFFEEESAPTSNGRIAVVEIDEHGSAGRPHTVLERDYHLSYPFVFRHRQTYYMVPESAENDSLDLYECVDFPLRWKFVMSLMKGIKIYDATLFAHGGRWWIFGNVASHPAVSSWDELFLFSSKSLQSTAWQAHPQNPIVSDPRFARPAGSIIEQQGRLYRPSQNSGSEYGQALNLFEIEHLDVHRYAEKQIGKIYPRASGDVTGVHTISKGRDCWFLDVRVGAGVGRRAGQIGRDLEVWWAAS